MRDKAALELSRITFYLLFSFGYILKKKGTKQNKTKQSMTVVTLN